MMQHCQSYRFQPRMWHWFLILTFIWLLSNCSSEKISPPSGFWYTFQQGDTLSGLSNRFGVSRRDIQQLNDIYDPADLTVGMDIFIPGVRPKIVSPEPRPTAPTAPAPARRVKRDFIWPSPGTISSGYGKRQGRMHHGIDLTRDRGRDIVASASGIVEFAGVKKGYGNVIIINHGKGIKTLYAHNQRIYVKKRQMVRQGKVISRMGSSGRSTGIHLHFEVQVNGKAVNPLRYLPIR